MKKGSDYMNITETIKNELDKMTKSEKRIATCFLSNQNDFAFETLDVLAQKINISTTSVIRFCRRLGFSGYKGFQEELRIGFKNELTLPDKFKKTVEPSRDALLAKTLRCTVDCIEKTFSELSPKSVSDAVSKITNAKRVFCFGLKESYALAHYAYTRFLTVRGDVYMLTAGQGGEIESLLSLREGDVCIFFLFHRYTGQSPQILCELKKRGVENLLITSPPYEEVEKEAAVLLPCFVDINGIKNSAAAPVCLIDYLCNAVVAAGGDKSLEYMKDSELLYKKFTF